MERAATLSFQRKCVQSATDERYSQLHHFTQEATDMIVHVWGIFSGEVSQSDRQSERERDRQGFIKLLSKQNF